MDAFRYADSKVSTAIDSFLKHVSLASKGYRGKMLWNERSALLSLGHMRAF